ncbi:hypothetical protein GE061_004717 [Apolygus lucorum]|uniref:Uncharacterized protein n=1 Tax=Apolygus lucorum TaxID=248454 RepID=A0A6A4J0L2_APOLU|nr:hypothetical protein GE061_004717 [Apolygus lucorum]
MAARTPKSKTPPVTTQRRGTAEGEYTLDEAARDTMRELLPRNLQDGPWYIATWTLVFFLLVLFWRMSFCTFAFYMIHNALGSVLALKYFGAF